jgi:lipoprotein NlpI
MRRRLALLASLLLATSAVAQDSRETFQESFKRCAEATAPPIVLVASCTAAIDEGRLLPRGLTHALLVRGFSYQSLRRFEAARADYDRALAVDPTFLPAMSGRADLLAAQRDYAGAVKELDRVIYADPSRWEPYKRRGDFQDWSGNHDAAIADYTHALDHGGGPKLLAERGAAYANKADLPSARADLERAINEAPDYAVGWFERARIRFETGDFAGAAKDFERAAELEPEDGFRALWTYLAAARAGDRQAEASLASRAESLDLTEWPGPLIEVFLGRRAPESVDESEAPAGWERTGRRVEIEFYLGMRDLLRGDTATARTRLARARDLGINEYIEHRTAMAELARLQK